MRGSVRALRCREGPIRVAAICVSREGEVEYHPLTVYGHSPTVGEGKISLQNKVRLIPVEDLEVIAWRRSGVAGPGAMLSPSDFLHDIVETRKRFWCGPSDAYLLWRHGAAALLAQETEQDGEHQHSPPMGAAGDLLPAARPATEECEFTWLRGGHQGELVLCAERLGGPGVIVAPLLLCAANLLYEATGGREIRYTCRFENRHEQVEHDWEHDIGHGTYTICSSTSRPGIYGVGLGTNQLTRVRKAMLAYVLATVTEHAEQEDEIVERFQSFATRPFVDAVTEAREALRRAWPDWQPRDPDRNVTGINEAQRGGAPRL